MAKRGLGSILEKPASGASYHTVRKVDHTVWYQVSGIRYQVSGIRYRGRTCSRNERQKIMLFAFY